MSDINTRCLETFPSWLKSLGDDLQVILSVLENSELGEEPRKSLAGGINYLFKSLDLIPDGIDDIGYLDDAFVLRLAAKSATDNGAGDATDGELKDKLLQLVSDTALIRELLQDELYARLEKYTGALANGAARGRTVDEILSDGDVFSEFSSEVHGFIGDYVAPGFSNDEKNIIKLRAFLEAKLPK